MLCNNMSIAASKSQAGRSNAAGIEGYKLEFNAGVKHQPYLVTSNKKKQIKKKTLLSEKIKLFLYSLF